MKKQENTLIRRKKITQYKHTQKGILKQSFLSYFNIKICSRIKINTQTYVKENKDI